MMMKCWSILSVVLLSWACSPDNPEDFEEIPPVLTRVTNELSGGEEVGFSFNAGGVIAVNSLVTPDFQVKAQTNANGEATGVFLEHPEGEERFVLVGDFATLDTARMVYLSYLSPPSTSLSSRANFINPYQVWGVQTHDFRFGKILIHTAQHEMRDDEPFAAIEMEWAIIGE